MEGNQISRTDPDSLPGSTEPSHHPSLAFSFWVWFVAGGLAIWILPMLTLHTLLGVSPHGRFSVLYSGWVSLVMPAYAVFAFVKVWRTGRSAGILSRWFSRSTVLAVYALVITVLLLQAHHMHGSTVRARVAEGLNMSSPALRAIEFACWDGSLDCGPQK